MSNYLYLVKCNEFYKIGVAGNIESRLAALQTGNPYQLLLQSCYEFENAGIVEQCLHQKFDVKHTAGEWFELTDADLTQFEQICAMLGGVKHSEFSTISEEATEEAEVMAEIISEESSKLNKLDFDQMINDGWRIEVYSRGDDKYWLWRKGSYSNRKSTYGGRFEDLPEQFKQAYLKHRENTQG